MNMPKRKQTEASPKETIIITGGSREACQALECIILDLQEPA